mgnify:CR=1 FL=1
MVYINLRNIYSKKNKKYYGSKPLEYSVSKSGIIGFTKSLAAFYKNTNIKSHCLISGRIQTQNKNTYFSKNQNIINLNFYF